MFNPGLKIGQIVKNADIVEIFKCGNMGGMRRSRTTNTLVIISDYIIIKRANVTCCFFVCQISIFYSDYTEYATNNYSNSGR